MSDVHASMNDIGLVRVSRSLMAFKHFHEPPINEIHLLYTKARQMSTCTLLIFLDYENSIGS